MRAIILGLMSAVAVNSTANAAEPTSDPAPAASEAHFFLWVEGGWSSFDLPPIHGYETGDFGEDLRPVRYDIEDGWFARGEVGMMFARRLAILDGISVAVHHREGDASHFGPTERAAHAYAEPDLGMTVEYGGEVLARAEQEFELLDVQLRLRHELFDGLSVNLEPFAGRMEHHASNSFRFEHFSGTERRFAQIDGKFYGVQAALEGRWAVAPGLDLRARGSFGPYRMSVDGDFGIRGAFTESSYHSEDFSGWRAGGEIGVDYHFTPEVALGVTAGVDHWTEMPYPVLTEFRFPPAPNVHIGSSDYTEYFVGGRLTFQTARY